MKIYKDFIIIIAFLIGPMVISLGQAPPAPPSCPPTVGGGGGNLLVGSSAPLSGPIEDGIPYILGLAFIYGAIKLKQVSKIAIELSK